MKHVVYVLFVISFLSSCAGNPPAWWNPNNRYGTAQGASAPAKPVKKTIVHEDTIDVADTSYEEEILTPLPQDPEPPSVQEVTAPKATAPSAKLTPEVRHSPADGTLPVPSVLE